MALSAVAESLQFVQAVLFGGLAIAAIVHWRRRGQAEGVWLAATFSILALVATASYLPGYPDDPGDPARIPVQRVLVAVLVLFPYLQHRFMAAFSTRRRGEQAAVDASTLALVAASFLTPDFPEPGEAYSAPFAILVIAIVVQWVAVTLLVAVRLWRAGRTQGMAARARMRTLAVGSLGLALAVVLAGSVSSGGPSGSGLELAPTIVALASGIALLAGFAPPPVLRMLWRSREEDSSALVKKALVEASSVADIAAPCTNYASRLFGGRGAVLVGAEGALLGMHGLTPHEAHELTVRVSERPTGGVGDPVPMTDSEGVLAVPCGAGWLAVQAGAYTPFFGGEEARRLQSVAALAELALERVVLDEQVRRTNKELVDAQELAQVGSWEWDVGSDTVRWSAELYRIHGIEPGSGDLTYGDVLATVHPDDRAAFAQTVSTACESGRPFDIDHRAVRPDGSVVMLHARGKVVAGRSGRPARLLGACQDVTERRGLENEVAHRTLHDPLTDLANRALFIERLSHASARRARLDSPMAVLCIDLDDFKAVNDSLGHGAGDDLLIAVAECLTEHVRPVDTVARLGGDEFGILLEDTGALEATDLAGRLETALARPLLSNGREVATRASIGIVVESGSASAEELLRNADAAMYAAKGAGRGAGKGHYRVFEQGMHAELLRRIELRRDLQRAIGGDELRLVYQPVVDLADGRATAVEALVRWHHPTRGLLSPLEFIPLAEESGLIVELGEWVLREAATQLRAWQQQVPALAGLQLHVNVSGRQLQDPDVVRRVEAALAAAEMDPALLTMEITESVLMGKSDASVERLWALHGLGVRVAIDDFGTGYSSLSYLRRLPIDTLKIDKAFVDGLTHGPEEEALARAIVLIAASLQMTAIAEGVETAAQVRRLELIGCTAVQGFYYSPPLPAEEVIRWLVAPLPLAAGAARLSLASALVPPRDEVRDLGDHAADLIVLRGVDRRDAAGS